MQLPQESAGPTARYLYGRYVIRRLTRSKLTDLAAALTSVNDRVREAARRVEDLTGSLQDAYADRDVADEDLDDVAQQARLDLASPSVDAVRKAPYTDVFPHGIPYYTDAPIEHQEVRYNELVLRLTRYLPETHPVRALTVPRLQGLLADWQAADTGVDVAFDELALARTERDAVELAWAREVEATYGALVELYGRKKAERYFPRMSRPRKKKASDVATT